MFKLHKPQLSGSIHSGHFMVSRLDDDEDDDNNDPTDDSSDGERDNGQSVEIDINNPDSVADAAKNLEITYPSSKNNEQVTSWNDLDRPTKRTQKQNQYLTYYTNTSSSNSKNSTGGPSVADDIRCDDNGIQKDQIMMDSQTANALPQNAVSSPVYSTASAIHSGGTTSSNSSNVMPTNLVINNNNLLSQTESNLNSNMILQQSQTQNQNQSQNQKHQQHQQQQQQQHQQQQNQPQANQSNSSQSLMAQSQHSAIGRPPSVQLSTTAAAAALFSEASRQMQLQRQQELAMRQHEHQLQLVAAAAVVQNQQQTHAHQVTIDTSLTKLLQCMSLYYSSKLTSPKWKSFKGLKLRLKYKIRLNNLIWRAWFLQYIRGRRPPGCQFVAPAETDVHKKSETIVLEGKYWKRKEKAIVDEYKKWRIFNIHKQKNQLHCFRPVSVTSE